MVLMYGCGKCSLPIGGLDERIRCDGFCDREYHMNCTSLNTFDIRRCVEHKNVLWLCDGCLGSFRKERMGSSDEKQSEENDRSNVKSTVGQLQSEVAKIKECIASLQTSLNCSENHSTTNFLPSSSTPERSVLLGRTAARYESDRTQLLTGSRTSNGSMHPSRKFWMFFTRVAKHVPTAAIKEMVSRSLQMQEEAEVVRLVPRWGNYDDWRYISFKVGVDRKYKDTAIAESTWPAGLLFKEFVQREPSYWEP